MLTRTILCSCKGAAEMRVAASIMACHRVKKKNYLMLAGVSGARSVNCG